jgi:HSP20 family protein
MSNVQSALDNVKELYREFIGTPAPELPPQSYTAFPPGVDPIHHAMEEAERLRVLSKQVAAAPSLQAWAPPADTYRSTDGLVFYVEIPGVHKEDLKVFVVGGECVVRGERKFLQQKEAIHPLSLERPWGPFERRFTLPPGVHAGRIHAHSKDGILEIRVLAEGPSEEGELNVEVE